MIAPEHAEAFTAWCAKVDDLLNERTGCNWTELCGDASVTEKAFLEQQTPEHFVASYCETYGIWDIREDDAHHSNR